MKKLFSFYFALLLLVGVSSVYYGCKKKDTTPAATCTDGIQNQNETGVDCGGTCTACVTVVTSPCTSSLTDNQVTSTASPGLTSIVCTLSGSTVSGTCSGGDIYMKFGGGITEGTYQTEQNTAPNPGKALIDFRPIFQPSYLCTSGGTVYVDDAGANYIIEFCSVNCINTSLATTAVTGRLVVPK